MRFKDHFLLTENPDDLYTQDSSAITFGFCSNFVFWFDPTSDTSFIPTHVELLLIAKAKHLNKPIESLVQSPEYRRKLNSFKKLYHEKGYMPLDCVNFLKGTDMLYGTTRDDFINDVPHAFLGRLSIKGNIISFWNPPNNFNAHTKQTVKDFLGYVNMNPETLTYNFELQGSREVNLTYHQFFNIKKEEEPKSKVDTKHIVHTTDPAKKQEVLKGMGVKPKTPIDIKTKYAMGESFKDHFNNLYQESAEEIYYTGKWGFEQRASYADKDAKAFIVDHDFNIIADNENQYHGGLIGVLSDMVANQPIAYNTNGTLSDEFKEALKDNYLNRNMLLRNLPNIIQGRLWTEQKVIGFWNTIGMLKNNLKWVLKMFNDNNLNPNEYQWEIPDVSEIYSFEEFKQELGIRVPNKEEPVKQDFIDKPLHLAPPEKKAALMKAQGIKPKAPLGAEQRFKMGESFKDHYLNYIKESKSSSCIVVDVQPTYYNFYKSKQDKQKFRDIINFVNNQTGPTLLMVNAEETGITEDTIEDIKYFWEENGFTRNWNDIEIIDKGYGYLRPWMDQGVSNSSLIKAIRIMYQNRITDSREITEDGNSSEKWKELLNDDNIPQYDPISVEWLSIKKLKEYNNCYIMGGGRNECLREVELLMNAFNIKYKRIDKLIYG